MACTCWELRHLADSAEFWQPLYQRFFADVGGVVDPAQVGWKAAFRMEVRLQREREQVRRRRESNETAPVQACKVVAVSSDPHM